MLVVLGAQVVVDSDGIGNPSTHLEARISGAAAAIQIVKPPTVVLSGGYCVGVRYDESAIMKVADTSSEAVSRAQTRPSEAAVMQAHLTTFLAHLGADVPTIVREELSTSTQENAIATSLLLQRWCTSTTTARRPLRVALLTNAFHLHRSIALFVASLYEVGLRVALDGAVVDSSDRDQALDVVIVPHAAEPWAMRCLRLLSASPSRPILRFDVEALVARVSVAQFADVPRSVALAHAALLSAFDAWAASDATTQTSLLFGPLAPMEPVAFVGSSLRAVATVRHGFFSRFGGASSDVVASLDFSGRSSPRTRHVNAALVTRAFGLPSTSLLKTVNEVHGNVVVRVDALSLPVSADGMVTTARGVALGILTADCCPVLLATRDGTAIGALHAGWRGTCNGIVEAGVCELLGVAPAGTTVADVVACTGPCIERPSYQVADDVRSAWLSHCVAVGVDDGARFIDADPATDDRYLFDVPGAVRALLVAVGVTNVEHVSHDTFHDRRFYSYRRAAADRERNGNQLSVIVLR